MIRSKAKGTDARFFSDRGSRKGENHELREELRHQSRDRKRDAVKKVIANMTVGKDVSTLFADVVNCIQTGILTWDKGIFYSIKSLLVTVLHLLIELSAKAALKAGPVVHCGSTRLHFVIVRAIFISIIENVLIELIPIPVWR